MAVTTTIVAEGPGWQVRDVTCDSGPRDRAFEEQHRDVSIAIVTRGSFQYRTRSGSAVLVPGSLLLGNAGACFECGHEHAPGDRCLAFHIAPQCFEDTVAAAGGATMNFDRPSLPPLPQLTPILAAAESARDAGDSGVFEEIVLRLCGAVAALLTPARVRPVPSVRDVRRVTLAARRIEADADSKLSIAALASEAAMSPYHFLRTFRRIVGLTPHQYILRTRLNRAALRLRAADEPVASIAFDAGFNDLSTFNRRFRRLIGVTPSDYRSGSRTV
ncbi:MAG: helix-turn-helix transcriptional regulator [Proteobacteria bacterium]|nr:helix-turn-helix transcriptional regulator [Pseudomonadota bacterium]